MRKFLLLKNFVTSEGAVSHNVLYQQLSIARYQVSFSSNSSSLESADRQNGVLRTVCLHGAGQNILQCSGELKTVG